MAIDAGTVTVKVNTEIDKVEGAITRDEPVIVGHAALWLLAMVGEFIVGHTHLVTQHQWDGLQSSLIPFVTTALLAVSAARIRSVVVPAGRVAKALAASAIEKAAPLAVNVDPGAILKDLNVTGKLGLTAGQLALAVEGGPTDLPPVTSTPPTPPAPPAAPAPPAPPTPPAAG